MKFEFPMLASLALFTTELLTRIAVQGIDQALVSAVVERGIGGLRAVKRLCGLA